MSVQRAILRGTIANLVQTRNMFTAQLTVTGGDDAPSLWDVYLGTILQPLQSVMQNTVTFTSREIQEYVGGTWATIDDAAINYAGTNTANDQMPNATAFVWIAKTLAKRVVGRKFWSGIAETWCGGNTVVGGAVASIAQAFAAYIAPWTSLSGSTFAPGVVDKAGAFHGFTGGFVSTFLGSMRRRKPGVGM